MATGTVLYLLADRSDPTCRVIVAHVDAHGVRGVTDR